MARRKAVPFWSRIPQSTVVGGYDLRRQPSWGSVRKGPRAQHNGSGAKNKSSDWFGVAPGGIGLKDASRAQREYLCSLKQRLTAPGFYRRYRPEFSHFHAIEAPFWLEEV
jgi:hypothetical protein